MSGSKVRVRVAISDKVRVIDRVGVEVGLREC
jgi:hypothetical protein